MLFSSRLRDVGSRALKITVVPLMLLLEALSPVSLAVTELVTRPSTDRAVSSDSTAL